MKKNIHPTYHKKAKIICSCGMEYEVGSTVKEMHIEICSHCHPFYTGRQKLVDTEGRLEQYRKRAKKTEELKRKNLLRKKQSKQKKKK